MTKRDPATLLADARVRRSNDRPVRRERAHVVYWMQAYRRLERNHALDRALALSGELGLPLVVYEAVQLDYPWASRRMHAFLLEGMRDNADAAAALGLAYWPFVETPAAPARGLLRRIAERAAAIVTDDAPGFIARGQIAALAAKVDVAVLAIDGQAIVPLSRLGAPAVSAAQFRRRIHDEFAAAWAARAARTPAVPRAARSRAEPPFEPWDVRCDLDAFLATLPIDATVPRVRERQGGARAASARLARFVATGLRGYAEERSTPSPPDACHASGLSPWLHFGHLSVDALVEAALDGVGFTPARLDPRARGKRDGFFTKDPDVDGLLDEAITWRDIAAHWMSHRADDVATLDGALPAWARATLADHAGDARAFVYDEAAWEAGATHDALWNAAQRELVATGAMQNYLRMLWGKKVIEWSASHADAYRTLVHLNNKWALDGRDASSWAGILWCFGLFDRPWAPARPVLGTVRYMSSDNTARKHKLGPYLAWVATLPTIEEVRRGATDATGPTGAPRPRPGQQPLFR